MNHKNRKILFIIGGILIIALVLYFSVTYFAKQKLNRAINELPEHIKVSYGSADINLLKGDVTINKPSVEILGKTTGKINVEIELEEVILTGFSYWNYLFSDTISIGSLTFEKPNLLYFQNKNSKVQSSDSSSIGNMKKTLKIDGLFVNNASIEMKNRKTDSIILQTDSLMLDLKGIVSNGKASLSKIPFSFNDILFQTKNLKYQINKFDILHISDVKIDKNYSKFSLVKLKTKYGQKKLSTILDKERDHFNLEIATLEINDQVIEFEKESKFRFGSRSIVLEAPNAVIYRDKLVVDDNTQKPIYSEMLRNLKFDLSIDSLKINNGKIIYEEKAKKGNPAGKLEFENLNAKMEHVGNTYDDSQRLKINVKTDFMKTAPVEVDWSFNVNDNSDAFIFKADLGRLHANSLNQFTKPNVRVKLEGELLQTYFTISGNKNRSQIVLKTDYEQLDIILLQEDENDKRGLISDIVNIFVSKNSNDKENDFRYGYAEDVQRDKTKSIFNFVWLNIKDGLKDAVTGSGKKKDQH